MRILLISLSCVTLSTVTWSDNAVTVIQIHGVYTDSVCICYTMKLATVIKWTAALLALSGRGSCGVKVGGSCQFQTPSGVVDLSPLANQGGEPRFKDVLDPGRNFGYSWNPCSVFNEGSCQGVEVCQVMMEDPSTSFTLGTPGEGGFVQQGDTLFYHYVDNSVPDTVRETYIELACDMNVEGKLEFQQENPTLNYRLKLTSQYACPRVQTTPPPPAPTPTPTTAPAPPTPPGPWFFSLKMVVYLLAAVLVSLCILNCMVFLGLVTRRRRTEEKRSHGHTNHAFEKKPLPP